MFDCGRSNYFAHANIHTKNNLAAATTRTAASSRRSVSVLRKPAPSRDPIKPPKSAAASQEIDSCETASAEIGIPTKAAREFTKIKSAETPAAVLASAHFIKSRIGVKKNTATDSD